MSQISHMVVERLVTTLTLALRTNVPASDPSRAGEVKAYRFQESPLEPINFVWISTGNPSDPTYRDGRISVREDDTANLRLYIPDGEIGGGHYWWRRGRVSIGCYYILSSYSQSVAADHAHKFLGRTIRAIEQTNVADLRDEFGEQAYQIIVPFNSFFEGGGPPAQYIWRGEIAWQVLTHRQI